MRNFEIIEHTADVGIEVISDTLEGLFEESCVALASLMFGKTGKGAEAIKISFKGIDYEDLLVAFLNELIFLFDTESFVFSRAVCERLEKNGAELKVFGQRKAVVPYISVKAATYHDVRIRKEGTTFKVRIILDV